MSSVRNSIQSALAPLVGVRLAIARSAGSMRVLHFGEIRAVKGLLGRLGSVGDHALHIQCPWRIEGPEGIVTGYWDYGRPDPVRNLQLEQGAAPEDFDLQDRLISALLCGYDPATRSHANATGNLVVETVDGDDFGGATIRLTGGYRLVLFPAGTQTEDWRFFRPGSDASHFVIEGGRIRDPTAE